MNSPEWATRSATDPWRWPDASTVHVVRADLDAGTADEALLSADERARAARLRTPLLRQRFTTARGYLRHMLAGLLDVPPKDVDLDAGPHGKPALAAPHPPLEFNLSHAGGVALYAFSRHAPVGIDVERARDDLPWERMAARYFAPEEAASIDTSDAFFACWTRKEAVVKATGTGLSQPLRDVV
ncbi:MAG: 4-phosphopantetheinyl transferase, partial [Actinomycetota bacterium]|nr:4-phosphopantetheinyl transferase [Actinomycetota bacterium]